MRQLRLVLLLLAGVACGDNGSGRGASSGRQADAANGQDGGGESDGGAEPNDIVVFDNADGDFVWTPTRYAPCCDTLDGLYLDLTLAAGSQTGEPSASAVEFFKHWEEANITEGGYYFRSWGDPDMPPDGLSVAQGEGVVLEGGVVEMFTIHPPLDMSVGDTVGPALTWRNAEHLWEGARSGPQTVHLADPGGEYPPDHVEFTAGIIGIRFALADGVHYGFVDLAWDPGSGIANALHVPVRWGYQTAPDTPLAIPP